MQWQPVSYASILCSKQFPSARLAQQCPPRKMHGKLWLIEIFEKRAIIWMRGQTFIHSLPKSIDITAAPYALLVAQIRATHAVNATLNRFISWNYINNAFQSSMNRNRHESKINRQFKKRFCVKSLLKRFLIEEICSRKCQWGYENGISIVCFRSIANVRQRLPDRLYWHLPPWIVLRVPNQLIDT